MAKKKLTDILGENYLDKYSQKTEVGKSFVAMHRDGTIHDFLGDKGKTEGQFKSLKGEAPYKKAPQKGFPGEDQFNDYNLPTYYDDADNEGDPEEGDKNDKKRSMKVQEEPDEIDEDDEIVYVKLDEISNKKLGQYVNASLTDIHNKSFRSGENWSKASVSLTKKGKTDSINAFSDHFGKSLKRRLGVEKAVNKMTTRKESVTLTPFKDHLNEAAATRKHFVTVANTVRAIENPTERQKFANHHADIFAGVNPKFDHARFHAHAGTSYTPPEG